MDSISWVAKININNKSNALTYNSIYYSTDNGKFCYENTYIKYKNNHTGYLNFIEYIIEEGQDGGDTKNNNDIASAIATAASVINEATTKSNQSVASAIATAASDVNEATDKSNQSVALANAAAASVVNEAAAKSNQSVAEDTYYYVIYAGHKIYSIDSIAVYKTTEPGTYINSNCISFNNKIEIITPIPEFLKTNIEKATSHEDVAVAIATAVINFQANDNVNYIENLHMNKEAEPAATAIATAVAAARDETETDANPDRMNKDAEEEAATAIATAVAAARDETKTDTNPERMNKEAEEAAATAIATAVVAFETEEDRARKEEEAAAAIATAAKAEEEDRARKEEEEEAAAARAEAEAKAKAERMNKEAEEAATAIATAAKAEEDRARKEEEAATAARAEAEAKAEEEERVRKEVAIAIATAAARAKAEEEDRARKEEEAAAAARAEAEAKAEEERVRKEEEAAAAARAEDAAMAVAVAVNAINDDNMVLEYNNFLSIIDKGQNIHTEIKPTDVMANRLAMSLINKIETYNKTDAPIAPNKTGGYILHAGDTNNQDKLRTAFNNLYGIIQKNVDTFTSHPLIYKLNSLDENNFNLITDDNVDLEIKYCPSKEACSTFDTDPVRNELSKIISILIPKMNNVGKSDTQTTGTPTHIRDLLSTYTTSVNTAINYNTPYANATTFKNWTEINEKMKDVYTRFLKNIYDKATNGPDDNKLENKVDEIIGNINKNKLLTYIKINNTNPNDLQTNMNKRFKLLVTDKKNKLVVKYNPDNIPYYNKERMKRGEITRSEELTNMMKKNSEEPKKYTHDRGILTVNKYDNEYLYGNFTNVFVPSETNTQIAQQMDVVINKLQKTEPVFIVGYGASGAGKTSSLIQYNNEPGIIIQLCNMMASNVSDGFTQYKSIEVKIEEYYVNITHDAINTVYSDYTAACDKLNCNGMGLIKNGNSTQMSFKYNNNNWTSTTNDNNTTLGDKLMEHIDTNRKVGATTNNPNSSRSHVLVYVKFKNRTEGPDPVLIIGDLAGVENKFACENTDILTQFLTIKRDTKPGDTANIPIPFYRDIRTCNEIIVTESSANKGGGATDNECDNLITPLFDFVNMKENDENKKIIKSVLEANPAEADENIGIKKYTDDDNIARVFDAIGSFDLGDNPYDKILHGTPETSKNTLDPNLIDFFRSLFSQPSTLKSQKTQPKSVLLLQQLRNSLRKLYNNTKSSNYDSEIYDSIISEIQKFSILDNIIIVNDVVINEYNIIDFRTTGNISNDTIDKNKKYKIDILIDQYPLISDILSDTIKNIKKTILPFPRPGCKQMTQSSFYDLSKNEKIIIKNMPNEDINDNNKIILKKDDVIITQQQLDDIDGNTVYYNCKETKNYGTVNESSVQLYVAINNYYISHIQKIFNEKVKNPIIDYIQNLQKNKHALNETPYLKGVYKADVKQNHINAAKTIIETTRNQLHYAEKICKIRRAEGYYINYTLQQMRDDIRKTVLAKGDGLSPDFVNDCITDYCEGREYECFKPEIQNNSTDDMYEPTSLIFKNIKKYLYQDKAIDNKAFFERILVGIFCVFNISNSANNPPPVPYVDINELKKAFYNSTDANIKDLVTGLNTIISNINNPFANNSVSYKSPSDYGSTGNVTVDFDSLTKLNTHIVSNKNTGIIKMNDFTSENKQSGGFYGKIESVIKEIDNHNASTSIGTLDFTDNIAKYITVHNTCKYNDTIEDKLQLKEFGASKKK